MLQDEVHLEYDCIICCTSMQPICEGVFSLLKWSHGSNDGFYFKYENTHKGVIRDMGGRGNSAGTEGGPNE